MIELFILQYDRVKPVSKHKIPIFEGILIRFVTTLHMYRGLGKWLHFPTGNFVPPSDGSIVTFLQEATHTKSDGPDVNFSGMKFHI